MNEKFLEVGDVMQILGISRSAAYKIMRQINSELEKKGYIVIRGKVSRKYFEERIYGMSDTQDDTQGDTQDDTEEKIIKMIKDNPQVSTADMAKELKIGIATVKRKIKKMSNVSYVGSGYSGHWEING